MVENPDCRWNFDTIYDSSRDVFPVWAAILLFPVIAITFFELAVVENPRVQLETNTFCCSCT